MPAVANKSPVTVSLAREYAAKHPKAGTRTLASMLLRDAPQVYRDFEHARNCVRHIRGERGKLSKKCKAVVPTTKAENAFVMPLSDAKPVEPIDLGLSGKGLVSGDWHIPYHDQAACEGAVNHAIKTGHTEWLLLNGDILDCYQLSRWEKDPRKRRFSGELDVAHETLKSLTRIFKRIVYKLGNHEVRYESYLRQKASELIGIEEFELHKLLKADELGFEIVKSNQIMRAGGLSIIHGHEFPVGIANPVNPARGLFLRAKTSSICSHFHQSSQHTEGDLHKRPTSCWSLGCLCELSPEYAPINKWNHGAALVSVSGQDFDVQNFRILRGKVV